MMRSGIKRCPEELMLELSTELVRLRDLLLNMSAELSEMKYEMPTTQRAELCAEVERYLDKLRITEK